MAGGTFDNLAGKVRPGTYINFESTRDGLIETSQRGTVLIPLINHDYGPAKEFITLTGDSPDAKMTKLGYSIYDNNSNMLLIREALKNSNTVIIYIPNQGSPATGTAGALTATARYGGARGNKLRFIVTTNPIEGFDVTVYLDTAIVSQYEGLTTIDELVAQEDAWIKFAGTGDLAVNAGITLSGGTSPASSAGDITDFLDASESIRWNTLAFPVEATGEDGDPAPALLAAVKSKIIYLREEAGKYRKAVVPNFAANYEGIINVTNSVALEDRELTTAQVTAWVAGVDAGASNTQSNTFTPYAGAVDIIGQKTNAEAITAINNGEFFFSWSEQGEVVVEYDINSLTSFDPPKDKTYRKNRVLRVLDTFAESLMLAFPPNKFDNSTIGWDVMDGVGRSILKQFEDAGAIKNVDYDNDFYVDRSRSADDATYFNVGIEALDSAEKLFFTVKTR